MSENIISVARLQSMASDKLVIIDCRFSLVDTALGRALYQQSHIPGAHYLHLDDQLSGVVSNHGGRHPLPEPEQFQQTMQDIGVNHDSLIVVYDDQRFAFASRLWWLLRYFGHESVWVLDGGYAAWQAEGLSCIDKIPQAIPGNFMAKVDSTKVVDRQQVIARCDNTLLIDSREPARYQGLEEPIDPVAGCIEGAVNYPWQAVTDEKALLSTDESYWDEASNAEAIIVYCGSGVTACVNLLSLVEAGYTDAKLYAGSWSDWCSYL